jgi:abortive infection bacteriophage resistance protein
MTLQGVVYVNTRILDEHKQNAQYILPFKARVQSKINQKTLAQTLYRNIYKKDMYKGLSLWALQ